MKKRITLLTAALILNFTLVFSQLPVKQWDACFGGLDGEDMRAMQQTTDGGYILGGKSLSGISGNKTQASQGEGDYWIVKTDAQGVKQWDKRFGGSGDDVLIALEQTADGGYILGGHSASGLGGDKSQPSQGEEDYWIVKTDANGVKQWDARFGGDLEDEFYGLDQTPDGGYILGGGSASGISGDRTQPSWGQEDFWIVKIDANGIKQWDKRFGGDGIDELHWLRLTADGGYILAGKSDSGISGDKTQPSQGSIDYWMVKTDANGIKEWDGRYGAKSVDILFNIEQTTDGGYILGGYTLSDVSGDKTQPTQGFSDYWLVKTDPLGVLEWEARYGGTAGDAPYALIQTTDGGYMFAGRSESEVSGDVTQPGEGQFDYWLVKTDENGIQEWDARFGGDLRDDLFALQQTTDGGYILGGYSKSNASGDKSQPTFGSYDYWILKVTSGAACEVPFTFTSTNITSSSATLSWNVVPGAVKYKVRYRVTGTSEWTNTKSNDNDITLTGLAAATKYSWEVKTICSDEPKISSDWSEKQKFTTGALRLSEEIVPEMKVDVYPNPVSQSATISFYLNDAMSVVARILDVNGRTLSVIADENFSAGNNLITFNRTSLSAGIYFLQITTNEGVHMKKIVIE